MDLDGVSVNNVGSYEGCSQCAGHHSVSLCVCVRFVQVCMCCVCLSVCVCVNVYVCVCVYVCWCQTKYCSIVCSCAQQKK